MLADDWYDFIGPINTCFTLTNPILPRSSKWKDTIGYHSYSWPLVVFERSGFVAALRGILDSPKVLSERVIVWRRNDIPVIVFDGGLGSGKGCGDNGWVWFSPTVVYTIGCVVWFSLVDSAGELTLWIGFRLELPICSELLICRAIGNYSSYNPGSAAYFII